MFQPSGRVPLDADLPQVKTKSSHRSRAWLVRHRSFFLTVALLGTTRAFLFLIARPNGFFASNSDYDFYLDFAKLTNLGLYPFVDYWLEYPPLFPWLAVLVYRLSLVFPPMFDQPIFWFRLLLGGTIYLFEIANLVLVYLLALEIYGRRRAWVVLAIYGTLLVPIYTWLAWFDTMPLFFLLASLWLTLRGRLYLASAIAGIGFMVKIVPALALLVAMRYKGTWRNRLLLSLPFLLAVSIVAAPFLVVAPGLLAASFVSMAFRSPWETIWAVAEGYYGYGQVAPLGERFDPATAHFVTHSSWIPLPLVAAAFGTLYFLVWRRLAVQPASFQAVLLAGLTINIFLLANKGYSPQFLAYAIPFILLSMPNPRGLGYAIVLSAVNLVEWPIYHTMFAGTAWILTTTVLVRTLLLVVVSIEYAARLFAWGWWPIVRSRLSRFALAAFLIGACVFLQASLQQWSELRYREDPLSSAFAFMRSHGQQTSGAFVFSDDELYTAFYPFFHHDGEFYLFRPQHAGEHRLLSPKLSTETRRARLNHILREHGQIWLVRYADDWTAFELVSWLGNEARLEAWYRIEKTNEGKSLPRPVIVELWHCH